LQSPPVAAPKPPPIPSRPWPQVLASFMQQSNIRWGELLGRAIGSEHLTSTRGPQRLYVSP